MALFKSSTMKLTIITVNLNDKAGLERTLRSVAAQTYQDFEHIIVDGLSKDGSQDLFINNPAVDNWLSEKDKGVYDAMNKGISLAKGEYLLFLNSGDSLFAHDSLATVIPHLNAIDLVYGNLCLGDPADANLFTPPAVLTFDYLAVSSLPHPASFIKRELFDKYGRYELDYKIVADWVFFVKTIARENISYKHIEQVISVFYLNGMSSNPQNGEQIMEERTHALNEQFPIFYHDYLAHQACRQKLARIQSSKGFRILKSLGVKKFQ